MIGCGSTGCGMALIAEKGFKILLQDHHEHGANEMLATASKHGLQGIFEKHEEYQDL